MKFTSQFQFVIFFFVSLTVAHTVPGVDTLQRQALAKRDANLVDAIYNNLKPTDSDFILTHLGNLTNATGSKCDQCKNKIRYARSLIDNQPEKEHLISLLLFKYCLSKNKNKESKCDLKDFFVTTTSKNKEATSFEAGIDSTTGVNFYDNDFIKVLKLFNTSSETDLEYYCYYKESTCKLPKTPDLDVAFNLLSKWPKKDAKHEVAPTFDGNLSTFNVLHISDFHIQLRYQVGSEANCSKTPCCLPESVNAELPTQDYNFTSVYTDIDATLDTFEYSFYPDAHYTSNNSYVKGDYYDLPKSRGYNSNSLPASTFGTYMCDSPEVLLNNTLAHISNTSKNKNFEFTIFTGDLVDHDVVHCDADTTKKAEIRGFGMMKHFLDHIPVYPSLGNHDTFPYGQLSPLGKKYNNTYNWNDALMSDLWVSNGWLAENKRNFVKSHYSGFSTITERGLKVISLNSNCYYQKNLWSYVNITQDYDLFGQWDFLIDELTESERKGERVWIMAHIPPSDFDALPIQSKVFAKIVERFSPYTIANIFYGHTHMDQFSILYSSNGTVPVNMAWISQSVTPLSNYNPSWRYYEVEDKTFNIINSYNYYTQLNETFTNGGDEPEWDFEYSARDAYDPKGDWPSNAPLNATFWDKYVASNIRNESNIEFNQLYADYMFRLSPYVPDCKNGSVISDECYNNNWCTAGHFTSEEFIACERG